MEHLIEFIGMILTGIVGPFMDSEKGSAKIFTMIIVALTTIFALGWVVVTYSVK